MNNTSKFVDKYTTVDNFVFGGPEGIMHIAVIAINDGAEELFDKKELIEITDGVLDFNEELFGRHEYLFESLLSGAERLAESTMVNKLSENIDELIFREGGEKEIKKKLKQHLKGEV